jgi:hypothetical protein
MRLAVIALCLLATTEGANAAVRFGKEIAVSSPEFGVAPGQQLSAATATNGDTYFVLWGGVQGSPLTGARFTHDGMVLDPYGIDVAPSQYGAGVIWTGRQYLIAWVSSSGGGLCVRTLTAEGQLGPIRGVGRAGWTTKIGMATNGTSVAITLSGAGTWLVDGEGTLLREVYTWGSLLDRATVASAGSGYVIAHTHPYGEGQYLEVVAVSAEGVATRPREIVRSHQVTTASVGTDGETPLLVWGEATSIRVVRLSAQGVPKSEPQDILQLPFGQWPRQFDLTDLSLVSRTTIAPAAAGTYWPEHVIALQGQRMIAYQRTPRDMLLGRTWRGFIRMEPVPRDELPDQRSR